VEAREYDVMRALEDRHWWYRSLHDVVGSRLGGAATVLDVGCGTGGMLARLSRVRSLGVDLSPAALSHARRRGLRAVARASAGALPFPDGSFDAVLALDLLYHRDVDDEGAALAECRRVVRPGGRIMIHAAAYRWLYGSHDRAVHGVRRYTVAGLRGLVLAAGLEVVELSYRNALALPWAVVSRGLGKVRDWQGRRETAPISDLRPLPAWLNAALEIGARAENAWLRFAPLPVGLSVWCVARRPAAG
jgi:SAM-dependent methyltransferase